MIWYYDVASCDFDNAHFLRLFDHPFKLYVTGTANPTVMPAEIISINPIINICYYLSSVLVFSLCYDTLVQRLH